MIGVAAFLGAGYRTPLAGVMFVAETTGRPGFVVPALIASVASQLVMGDASVSPYQVASRRGHLERRFQLPISAAIDADVLTVPPDTTISEFYEHHLLLNRQPEVPVVVGARYDGMASLEAIRAVNLEDWPKTHIGEIADRGWPTGSPSLRLEQAIEMMEKADVDTLPVLDGDRFVGVVTTADILRLDQILGPADDT